MVTGIHKNKSEEAEVIINKGNKTNIVPGGGGTLLHKS